MQSQANRNTHSNQNQASRDVDVPRLLIAAVAFFIWFFCFAQFGKSLEYQSTRLIMHSAACRYVESHSIPTRAYSVPDTCSVTASYRPDMFGRGGVILQGDTYIELADNQILVAEVLPQQPWTEPQLSAAKWFGLASLALVVLIAVLVI